MFTHLGLLLLAVKVHQLVGAALGHHHLALLPDLRIKGTQLGDKIVVDLLLLLQLLKELRIILEVAPERIQEPRHRSMPLCSLVLAQVPIGLVTLRGVGYSPLSSLE